MSSTVTLLKTSAITAITADLTAAVASSASAASSSASAASSSASAASSSATAAASSAASASSSAASAANAIANTYKGGVAGGSVPATSALAGDYYRITAAGTSQSKTWTVGDLAIYNGSSGSWTQVSGNLVDPSSLAAQRNALAPAQALSGNGTAGSTLTLASTPSGDQTWAFDVQVPVSNPAAGMGIFNAGGNYGAAGTFGAFISVGGLLTIDQFGATGSDYREATSAGFVSAYAGTVVRLIIKLSGGVLTVNANGTYLTVAQVSGGTPPAWGASLANGTVYLGKMSSAGSYLFTGTIRPLGIENYALSAAQETYVYQTGSFPASDYGASGAPAGTTVTAGAFVIGKKYRIVSVGTTSFTGIGASANTVGVEFTATGVGTGTGTALVIGLLVAPDPAQLGSGLSWYDVSGNNATITLPASGVDWVNRWSGTLPGPATVAGNLTVTGVGVFGGGSADNGVVANVRANSNHFVWQVGGVNKMVQYIDASNKLVWYQGGTLMSLADTGALAIANTSAIKGVRTVTATVAIGTVAVDAYGYADLTLTGAALNDTVTVNRTDGVNTTGLSAFVSATNTVRVILRNDVGFVYNYGDIPVRITVISF